MKFSSGMVPSKLKVESFHKLRSLTCRNQNQYQASSRLSGSLSQSPWEESHTGFFGQHAFLLPDRLLQSAEPSKGVTCQCQRRTNYQR